eukprot:g23142.t1
MPEVSWVVFNPWAGTPPGGTVAAQTRKRGAVLEVSPQVTLNAKLKANSPYGTLVVEDFQAREAADCVNKGAGNCGSNRLEVDLAFYFTASMSTRST